MEDDLLGQAQAVLSGSAPKGGDLLSDAMSVFEKNKPDPKFVDQERRYGEAVQYIGQKRGGDKEFGFGVGLRLRTEDMQMPFQGVANYVARGIGGVENPEKAKKAAEDAYAKGEATDNQLALLASHEYETERNKTLGVSGRIGKGIAGALPMASEALAGAGAVKAIGGAIGGGAQTLGAFSQSSAIDKIGKGIQLVTGAAPAATRIGGLAQGAAQQILATPMTPGLWFQEAQQRAAENGGHWSDLKNVGAPMIKAAAQNAIMGHLGEALKGVGFAAGKGLGGAARSVANIGIRGAIGGPLMAAEQAGADALTTLAEKAWKSAGMDEKWTTDTDWGYVKKLADPKTREEGLSELAVTTMMGSLFSAFNGRKSDPVKELPKAIESLKKEGVPEAEIGKVIQESLGKPPETIENKEVRSFVEESQKAQTPEPPKTPVEEAKAEPAKPAAIAEIGPPEGGKEAVDSVERVVGGMVEDMAGGPFHPHEQAEIGSAWRTVRAAQAASGGRFADIADPAWVKKNMPRDGEAVTEAIKTIQGYHNSLESRYGGWEPPKDWSPLDAAPKRGLKEKAPETKPQEANEAERREIYGDPPGGQERRKYGLRLDSSEKIEQGQRGLDNTENEAIRRYGGEDMYRVDIKDSNGESVAKLILKEVDGDKGDTLIAPWISKHGMKAGEGKDNNQPFNDREMTALGKQLSELYPDKKILKYHRIGNDRKPEGTLKIVDLDKYRARQAKKDAAAEAKRAEKEAPKSESKKMTEDELFKVKFLDWREQRSGNWEEVSRHGTIEEAKQAAGKDGAAGQVDSGRTADVDSAHHPYGIEIPEYAAYRKKSAEKEAVKEPPAETPPPVEQPAKTKLDHILDRVDKDGEVTLTMQGEPPTRETVKKVIETAKARGIDAAFDGNNFLFRKLGPEGTKARGLAKKRQKKDEEISKKMNEMAKPVNDAFKKTERREDLTAEEYGRLNDFATKDYVKEGDKYVFGKPLTAAEQRLGQVEGGAPDAHPPVENGKPNEMALANAKVDEDRVRNGLPPLMTEARKVNAEVWDQAMSRLEKDPNLSADLVNELSAKSRATTVEENALLLNRKIALNNEYERTIHQANEAAKQGDMTQFDRLSIRAEELLGQIDKTDKVARQTGTEWGQAGQFRRQLAADDFSLGRMMNEAALKKKAPLTPEEAKKIQDLHAEINRLNKIIAELEAMKPESGKIGAKPKIDGMDATAAKIKINQAKRDYNEMVGGFTRANRPLRAKIIDTAKEANNALRAFITAYDLSAVFRQGGMLSLANPSKVPAAFKSMIKSALSKDFHERAEMEIRERPNARFGNYERSGLYLADDMGPLNKQEEAFMGRWVGKIPGVAASSRAFNGYLNRMRADVFDKMVDTLSRDGKATHKEMEAIANYINKATGRGTLGKFDNTAAGLAQVFFSPRYLASRFQIMSGQPFYSGGNWRTRKLIAKEYGKALAGLAVVYATAKALDNDVEITFDPRSADFGKMKFGRTRVDPLAGFSQLGVFGTRMVSGETVSTEKPNKVTNLRDTKFGQQTTGDVFLRFLRNKMAPLPGYVADTLVPKYAPSSTGIISESTGKPKGVKGKIADTADKLVPISINDVYDAIREQGIPKGTAISLLAILGMGTMLHEKQKK